MITYSIDAECKLVVTISSGVLNLEEIHAHLDRLKGDPAFRSDFSQLLDLRHVTHVDIDSHELRVLAEVTAFAPTSKRAVVAGAPEVFGVARMVQLYRDAQGHSDNIRVFTDFDSAWAWILTEHSAGRLTGVTSPHSLCDLEC